MLKLKDEKRNLIALNRRKEEERHRLLLQLGKGKKLDNLLSRLRKDMIKHKTKLKMKYKAKLDHLDTERKKDIEKKKRRIVIPEELDEFRDISIYDDNKRLSLCKQIVEGVTIGGVSLDEDERAILRLNPKFAVLTRLDDEIIEIYREGRKGRRGSGI